MDKKVYTIPLGYTVSSSRTYRTRKAMNIVEKFLERNLKTSLKNIKIGSSLNEKIWSRGMQKPPKRIKVEVFKEDDVFKVELFGHKPEIKEDSKESKEEPKEKKEDSKEEKKTEGSKKEKPKEDSKKEGKKDSKKDKPKKDKKAEKDEKPSNDWLKKDLKKYAEDKGIDIKSNDTKKDILKKIQNESKK